MKMCNGVEAKEGGLMRGKFECMQNEKWRKNEKKEKVHKLPFAAKVLHGWFN